MRSLRTFSTWILLGVMALAVVPREIWHACEHGPLAHHADAHGASVTASCMMCDLGLPVGTETASVELCAVIAVRSQDHSPAVRGTSLGFTALAADRGPPARC